MKTNLRHVPHLRAPFWCFNGHVHTIARSLFGDTGQPSLDSIEIPTPDNDFLELDCHIQPDSDAIITLFHGLEGSTERYYMVELMKVLIKNGYSVAGVNFRGCGSKLNDQPRFYHSGETNDYQTVFNWISDNYPDKTIGAVGFSLGGNALAKYLGETGDDSLVNTAVAVSVPYDLRLGSIILSKGFHRIYEYRFLRTLRKKLQMKQKKFPELPRFNGSTIYEFDDKVTAPLHGFDGADDYYEQCSARRFIDSINIDTLFIHSKEDPLCPIEAMPLAKINQNPSTDYIITEQGGHVGFWSKPRGWLNFIIENYLSSNL
ncbi:MAG: alpha/beta fold hydrolase [Aliifodinibius sp.]|nr:alpha/beta fold hydrolase [Fodinibius sp.]NIV11554.1 alpha/beta fold hydrolase [Fodinibius sp.]NIY25156.1 alpha/beta fold hydrolase [Fodinibius sp.]